ncbi:MAG: hypothetical protein KDA78_01495 [Planctomycetaceae bacterium]|nr:hypothetical protein [Planctomycetaceae bacterium]
MNQDDDLFRPEGDSVSQKSTSSGCGWKTVLIVLLSCTGLMFACCCGIGYMFYSMAPTIEQDPEVARQTAQKLLGVELEEGAKPQVAMKMNLLSMLNVEGAVVQLPEQSGVLVVAGLDGQLASNPQFTKSIEDAIQKEAGSENLKVLNTEVKEVQIDGQGTSVTIIEAQVPAKGDQAEKNVRQVRALINGSGDKKIFFMMIIPEEKWDEQKTIELLESLDVP